MIIGISGKKQSGKDLVGKIIQYLFYMKKEIKGRYYPPDVFIKELEYNVDLTIESGWEIRKFADKLKDIVCLLIGCTREQLENEEFKNTPLGEEWDQFGIRFTYPNGSIDSKLYGAFATKKDANNFEKNERICLQWSNDLKTSIEKFSLTPRTFLQLLGTECGRQIIHHNIWVNALMSDYKLYNGIVYSNWIVTDIRFPNEVKAIKDRNGIIIRINRNISVNTTKEHESETALDEYKNFDYIVNNDSSIENLIDKVKEILIKEKLI
jgi:hypothetical protein